MARRQLLGTLRLCCSSLQQSQACSGVLQPGPSSSWHTHPTRCHTTTVLHSAATMTNLAQQQARGTSFAAHAGSASALWPAQLQAWTAAARFATDSTQTHQPADADLRVVQAEIPEVEYHKLADHTLEHLQERLEVFVEDMDIDGGDVEHAQGVLTVKLGSHGTYVINKQTPNRQIWLSSPLTGPFRFDYHQGHWVYHRDGRELLSQLQQELKELLGEAPHLTD